MDERLLTEFLAEAEDAVEELYGELATLRARDSDGRARREALARVFRRVHTLKGSAASAGLSGVAALAHEFESLLETVRAGRVSTDARTLDAFDAALAALEETLAAARRGEDADAPRSVVERLRSMTAGEGAGVIDESLADTDESLFDAGLGDEALGFLDEQERRRLSEAVAEGARARVVSVSFSLEDFDERFRLLSDALSESGEIISTLPVTTPDAPERVGFRVLHATRETRAQTAGRVAPFGATVEELTTPTREMKETWA
ncbi:MAG TPA: Hpt domain-containing protein, partial [Pyrinomonadaceae bacterium]|nr:Hpt domain-containing protein [Pyrinomonadaceae bacterium]